MENQMTIDQVLRITINEMEGLKVPVGLMDEIGIPIARAISNIRLCIQAVEASREQQAQNENAAEDTAQDNE